MKKIFIVSSYYKPGYLAGGPVKSVCNFVKELNNQADFIVYTRNYDYGCKNTYGSKYKSKVIDNNSLVYYNSRVHFYLNSVFALVKENPDVMYLNSLFSVDSLWFALLGFILNYKIVLAVRGELDDGAIIQKKWKKKLCLYFLTKTHRRFRFHATSNSEANNIYKYFGNVDVFIAPNIVNKPHKLVKPVLKDSFCICFYSRIVPKKNLLFVIEVLSNINSSKSIIFDIWGPIEDVVYYDKCVELANKLPSQIIFNYKGTVHSSEGIQWNNYDLMFFPTLGENFGHVIFESLSNGTPVLLSPFTPWQSKGLENGVFVSKLDEIFHFVSTIQMLINLSHVDYVKLRNTTFKSALKYYADTNEIGLYRKGFDL